MQAFVFLIAIGPVNVWNGCFQVLVWKDGKSNTILGLETGIFYQAFNFQFQLKTQVWLLSSLPECNGVFLFSSQLLLINLNSILVCLYQLAIAWVQPPENLWVSHPK